VREILRAQIQAFDQLDTYGRMLAEKAFRQALVRRRRSSSD
jgi:predicted oxidoreductase